MRLGILGLPKVGKTTLFNLLTASRLETGKFGVSSAANVGVSQVPDARLERLRELYHPKKYTPATVEYVDIPGLVQGEGGEDLDLARLREVEGLLHVVRCFDDPELLHPGGVDPARDLETVDLELILADLLLVERRLERLAKNVKRGLSPEEKREQALLSEKILPALEAETAVREIALGDDDRRRLRGFQLLSEKPMLVVLNVGEDEIGIDKGDQLGLSAARHHLTLSAPMEEEVSRLETAEQEEFLADLGLVEPSLDRVIRASYELLGLISFFTVGDDEVRAWTLSAGSPARKAAGAIHSDIERGFIRAEVVHWEELVRLGSLAACREKGLFRLEGKEYVVRDGEVVHFRFNV